MAEAQVVARLQSFVGDVERWVSERASAADSERALFERGVDGQRAELAKVDRRLERAREQHDRMLDDDTDAEIVATSLRQLGRIEAQREQLADALKAAEARLMEWPTTDIDAALDYYTELREAISGRVSGARSVLELNATLRSMLEGVWMAIIDDGSTLLADFILRGPDGGPDPDIELVTRVDHWRYLLDRDEPIPPSSVDPGTTIERPAAGIALPPMRVSLGAR